jgi:hypothetical protein
VLTNLLQRDVLEDSGQRAWLLNVSGMCAKQGRVAGSRRTLCVSIVAVCYSVSYKPIGLNVVPRAKLLGAER